jgi:hypothetical protein
MRSWDSARRPRNWGNHSRERMNHLENGRRAKLGLESLLDEDSTGLVAGQSLCRDGITADRHGRAALVSSRARSARTAVRARRSP